MRIVSVSTWYPQAIESALIGTEGLGYADTLSRFEDALFGSDLLWSGALRYETGWAVQDVIANAWSLQRKWKRENAMDGSCETTSEDPRVGERLILNAQLKAFAPDVVVLQDTNALDDEQLDALRAAGVLLVAQISCPMPRASAVARLDLAFTSFPHYVDRLRRMGVGSVEFLPLAFEPTVVKRVLGPAGQPARDIEVSFVGGVGRNLHWAEGTDALEELARGMGSDRLCWYGYGKDRLADDSPLLPCWRGEAWGRDMYRVCLRSRVVVNRHGEVARGSGNNLRQYESTGCGACLVTDQPGQFRAGKECIVYEHPSRIVEAVLRALNDDDERRRITAAGNGAALEFHTYAKRMPTVAMAIGDKLKARRKRG